MSLGLVDFIVNGTFVNQKHLGRNLGLTDVDKAEINMQRKDDSGTGFSVASVELHTKTLTAKEVMDNYLDSFKRIDFY